MKNILRLILIKITIKKKNENNLKKIFFFNEEKIRIKNKKF